MKISHSLVLSLTQNIIFLAETFGPETNLCFFTRRTIACFHHRPKLNQVLKTSQPYSQNVIHNALCFQLLYSRLAVSARNNSFSINISLLTLFENLIFENINNFQDWEIWRRGVWNLSGNLFIFIFWGVRNFFENFGGVRKFFRYASYTFFSLINQGVSILFQNFLQPWWMILHLDYIDISVLN